MFAIDEIYTVSNFLSLCNKTIENNIPTCWLQGEISNLSRPASGHWYFSLKDNKGQIRCALFRLNQRNIKFTPENGMEILVRAAPTLYEARGDFQLIIQHLEPVGVGNLNLAFEQLKKKLAQEGLFEAAHKKPLPDIINTIGVISSSTGAVIQDIIKVLNKRYPFAKVLLFDSIVQGSGSAKKLSKAVKTADESAKCDVLILARGGGSLEDLWAFNEEQLARTIFATKTPIISAVGHETDTTIADFVADFRAPTPSAAAMLATPDRLELISSVYKLYARLKQQYQYDLQSRQHRLNQLKLSLPNPSRQHNNLTQQLDHLRMRLNAHAKSIITSNETKLDALYAVLKQHSPKKNIQHSKALNQLLLGRLNQQVKQALNMQTLNLETSKQALNKSIAYLLEKHKNTLSIQATSLHHLSPLNTLSRGFSIASNDNNQVLSSVKHVALGEVITTRLTDGKLYTKVERIEKE